MQNHCEIITIGDELLIGQVVDTNSAWIGQQLNKAGWDVVRKTAIPDDVQAIKTALDEARRRASLVLITGGLGPTKDDLTKATLAEYFNCGWRKEEAVEKFITDLFSRRNIPIADTVLEQALLPDKCETLFNTVGTAPGMWFSDGENIFISMPGVPYEMKKMMEDQVLPRLQALAGDNKILHKTIATVGIGESALAQRISAVEDSLPAYIKLAYLPNYNSVRLRFTARGTDEAAMQAELDRRAAAVREIAGKYIIAEEDVRLEEMVGRLLKSAGKTLATAESCTGGYIAHLITGIPGSSAYYWGGVVSYDNSVKISQLGVSENDLNTVGAVSKEVVEQMARGARQLIKTDYSVATSGIAGPDGGTPDKPVGTVWIAAASANETVSEKFLFHGTRQAIIERSAIMALEMVRKIIIKEN